jgi:hypothetical protein
LISCPEKVIIGIGEGKEFLCRLFLPPFKKKKMKLLKNI